MLQPTMMTKEEIRNKLYFWSRAYKGYLKGFYNLKTKEGKAEYLETCKRVDNDRIEIEKALKPSE